MDTSTTDNIDSTKKRALIKLERDLGEIITFLKDPLTVEVILNPDSSIWQEKQGERLKMVGSLHPSRAESIMRTIAGYHGKELTRKNPILECELPFDGSRFAGQISPVVLNPTFAIRKKATSIFTLEQYVDAKIMSQNQCEKIKEYIANHKNILVVGGTGSGKTTLLNAMIDAMVKINSSERIIIIEDTGELQCAAKNSVQYHTTVDISMTQLLKTTLRMRPDRILVGEVRGEEALDLLDAWNTGHDGGLGTLHSTTAKSGLTRLKSLISRNKSAPKNIEPVIAESVHVIVNITRTKQGRRINEIIEVVGYENNQYILKKV
ncbi:P-type conjugative transfer ATPase TrbB [Gilliamella sp. HK2]|uniref:P-type conjugative transfer ATPase TrbB n=1 Tax=unclassified Gilliamella TaxID=2685620 RepID=UPI00080D985D|nr:P-type conjugative transfer ATPase TrbB [Gilliamella apicola]OCG28984.1 P-type conjugative transfer ATPase TrbB [Gilliamella apicola]OCG31451.1 P-type conjugative transfer ATPase TrbB [Gilliamella apicola]